MLAVVKHINGIYKPDAGIHTPPTKMPLGYYENLSVNLRKTIALGNIVLYNPNLFFYGPDAPDLWSDPAAMQKALDTDPFLSVFGDNDGLIVTVDVRKPLDIYRTDIAQKDQLLRAHGGAVILGAYTKWCVAAEAANLLSRNPGYSIGIDPMLSIDNGGHFIEDRHASVPIQNLEV